MCCGRSGEGAAKLLSADFGGAAVRKKQAALARPMKASFRDFVLSEAVIGGAPRKPWSTFTLF